LFEMLPPKPFVSIRGYRRRWPCIGAKDFVDLPPDGTHNVQPRGVGILVTGAGVIWDGDGEVPALEAQRRIRH
jgi:hypothetical protein